jgi:hypothetical protein
MSLRDGRAASGERRGAVEEAVMRGEVEAGMVAGLGSALVVGLVSAGVHLGTGGQGLSWLAIVAGLLPPMSPEAMVMVGLGYGVVLGGLFGWMHRGQWLDRRSALVRGAVYGLGCGLAATLLAGPILHRAFPLTSAAVVPAPHVLPAALLMHALYGMCLGVGFSTTTYRVLGAGGLARVRPRNRARAGDLQQNG